MKQTTKRFLSMVIGLMFLVGALMLYFNFVKPAYEDSQQVKSKQLSQRLFLLDEQATIEKVRELISDYQLRAQAHQAVSFVLPPAEDVSGGVAQLYGIARRTGLVFESVGISLAAARSGGAQTPSSFTLRKPVGTMTMRARLTGSYENFKEFLGLLETNMRIFDVESVSLSSAGPASPGLFTYEISVATYYQRPE